MKGLPIRTPADLEDRPRHQQWLVDTLWGRQAVGLIGGEPKCGKSFLAFTVAVASGVPCLRHFPATPPGPALLRSTTKSHQIIRSHDHQLPRARSVDAYESAGGKVLHDLFARDDESGAWFEDPVLLEKLASGKLQASADPLEVGHRDDRDRVGRHRPLRPHHARASRTYPGGAGRDRAAGGLPDPTRRARRRGVDRGNADGIRDSSSCAGSRSPISARTSLPSPAGASPGLGRALQHNARAHRGLRRNAAMHRRFLQSLGLPPCRHHPGARALRPGKSSSMNQNWTRGSGPCEKTEDVSSIARICGIGQTRHGLTEQLPAGLGRKQSYTLLPEPQVNEFMLRYSICVAHVVPSIVVSTDEVIQAYNYQCVTRNLKLSLNSASGITGSTPQVTCRHSPEDGNSPDQSITDSVRQKGWQVRFREAGARPPCAPAPGKPSGDRQRGATRRWRS